MNKKRQILSMLDQYGSLIFADLFEKLETGQTKQGLSVYLNKMKSDQLVEQHHRTKAYSLTALGEAYVDGRGPAQKPLRDEPEAPAAPRPAVNSQLIAEFRKLHGQLGRVIKSMEDLLCPK